MTREEELKAEINSFLENFGASVKEIKYDGWPIWWFFKERFNRNSLLHPLPSHRQVVASVQKGRELGLKEKIKNKLTVFALKKFIEYNEKSKYWISKFNQKKPSSKTNKEKKRIMFLALTNAMLPDKKYEFTVDRVESALKEVREDSQLEEYLSVMSPLSHKNWSSLLNYPGLLYPYIDKEIRKKAKKNSTLLHKKWEEISEIPYDSVGEQFKPALNFFFSREMIYLIILYYETYKKIIQQEKIDLLCHSSGLGVISRCAMAAAHKSGIKSLHIRHGAGAPFRRSDEIASTYHAVKGPKYKERYVSVGINPENIFVTGSVFMDEIVPYIKEGPENHETKKILLATTPWLEDNRGDMETYVRYISKFLREINRLDNLEIILKLHPREKTAELYRSIIDAGGYENVKIVSGQGKDQLKSRLYTLITESDVVMCFGSTVGVEAMVIGRPSLVIDLIPNCYYGPILGNRKKVLHLNPAEDISKIVSKILKNQKAREEIINNQQEIIREYLYKVDGKAGKRVLKIIKELIK